MMLDNDDVFLAHFEGVLNSCDELCSLEITKLPDSYRFRIAPSLPKYHDLIIEEILKLCNMFHITIDMSKSMRTTAVISFNISLDN